jgi:tetratricopeptide (TPR) repeat protein
LPADAARRTAGCIWLRSHRRRNKHPSTSTLDALVDTTSSVTEGEGDAIDFFKRGAAYVAKGQYDSAIEDFDQAVRLNPNYAAAFVGRGAACETVWHKLQRLAGIDQPDDPAILAAVAARAPQLDFGQKLNGFIRRAGSGISVRSRRFRERSRA